MKRITLLLPMLFICAIAFQCSAFDIDHFLDRCAVAESRNNPAAIGDNGRARGAWQMWECAWADAESRLRWGVTWEIGAHGSAARAYARTYAGIVAERLKRRGMIVNYRNMRRAWKGML